jgi:hypothetical protein
MLTTEETSVHLIFRQTILQELETFNSSLETKPGNKRNHKVSGQDRKVDGFIILLPKPNLLHQF